MIDPLAEVVTLLQPQARFSKVVSGAGPWRVRRVEAGQPFYCVLLDGSCRLAVDGSDVITLIAGDFVLIPAAYSYSISGGRAAKGVNTVPVMMPDGVARLGRQDVLPDVQMLIGHCTFGSPDAALLVTLLPEVVHVRGEARLATLVQLVGEESRAQRPAREVILAHLIEVLFIEALRCSAGTNASAGLLRGLADERLSVALHRMHEDIARTWTVAQLAQEAALSRSAFFERFNRAVGVTPMEYLLRWRMAMAKNLLGKNAAGIADIAERVGYGSASAFSVAFTRHVGLPPAHYARRQLELTPE